MVYWDVVLLKFLSGLTLIGGIIIVLYFLDNLALKISGKMFLKGQWKYLKSRAMAFVFIVTLIATLGSLAFSELLHFTPCILCWYQRIFMYPQLFISLLALKRKDANILPYLVILSSIGALIAGYHYYGQVVDTSSLPCSAIGYSPSCAEKFFFEFGYITIPMMALTAFLLVIMAYHLKRNFNISI